MPMKMLSPIWGRSGSILAVVWFLKLAYPDVKISVECLRHGKKVGNRLPDEPVDVFVTFTRPGGTPKVWHLGLYHGESLGETSPESKWCVRCLEGEFIRACDPLARLLVKDSWWFDPVVSRHCRQSPPSIAHCPEDLILGCGLSNDDPAVQLWSKLTKIAV